MLMEAMVHLAGKATNTLVISAASTAERAWADTLVDSSLANEIPSGPSPPPPGYHRNDENCSQHSCP